MVAGLRHVKFLLYLKIIIPKILNLIGKIFETQFF